MVSWYFYDVLQFNDHRPRLYGHLTGRHQPVTRGIDPKSVDSVAREGAYVARM